MHIRGHVKFSYSMTDSEDTFVETVLGDLLAFFHHYVIIIQEAEASKEFAESVVSNLERQQQLLCYIVSTLDDEVNHLGM